MIYHALIYMLYLAGIVAVGCWLRAVTDRSLRAAEKARQAEADLIQQAEALQRQCARLRAVQRELEQAQRGAPHIARVRTRSRPIDIELVDDPGAFAHRHKN